MGALIPIIIGAIPAGIQLEQFLQALIEHQRSIQIPNRPDVTDEQRAFTAQLIDAVQQRINTDAALHP